MVAIATGVFKKVAIKRQTALNVVAPPGAAGTAQYMRRVSSSITLTKANYTSAEILASQQRRDFRHGVHAVTGSLSGELSVGGYQLPFEGVLRARAAAGGASTALTDVTIASSGVGTFAGTLTRAAGSWLTNGFKIGEVIRGTGVGAGPNTQNLLVTNVTALVMTVRALNKVDIVAQASGSSVTFATAGKKISIPQLGHTRDYFTIEHWFSDVAISEVFVDTIFSGATIGLPATGLATVEFPALGLRMIPGLAEYFTTPANAPIGPITAAVNGALIVNGVVAAIVTGMTITINGNNAAPGGVVGSNIDPDIFPGVIDVTGQVTALFSDATMRDLFINETECNLVGVFTGDNTASSGCIAFIMPRVKFNSADKDDIQTGITQTMSFAALENVNGGTGTANETATISIQDTAFI